MATVQPPDSASPTPKARETLSQFIAKILDQLSLSAWLPAGVFVASTLLLAQLQAANGDLVQALNGLSGLGPVDLVLLILAVVLATVLTQAFGFGAIRLLEGYWGVTPWANRLADMCCNYHIGIRRKLGERRRALIRMSFARARLRMLEKGIPRIWVDVIEADITGSSVTASSDETERARKHGWRRYAEASDSRRIDALYRRLQDYPQVDWRVMPTRLGNVLRAAEHRADQDRSADLQGWIISNFHKLPVALQSQHDEHRNRLDLYATLVLTFLVLAVTSVLLLIRLPADALVGAALSLLAAWLSRRAALASARGYGLVLEEVKRELLQREQPSSPTTPTAPSP